MDHLLLFQLESAGCLELGVFYLIQYYQVLAFLLTKMSLKCNATITLQAELCYFSFLVQCSPVKELCSSLTSPLPKLLPAQGRKFTSPVPIPVLLTTSWLLLQGPKRPLIKSKSSSVMKNQGRLQIFLLR